LQHVANEVLEGTDVDLRDGIIILFVNEIDLLLHFLNILFDIGNVLREIEGLDLVREDHDLLLGSGLGGRGLGLDPDSLRLENLLELGQLSLNIRYFFFGNKRFDLEHSLVSLSTYHRHENLLAGNRNVYTLGNIQVLECLGGEVGCLGGLRAVHQILRLHLSDEALLISDRRHLVEENGVVAVAHAHHAETGLNFVLQQILLQTLRLLNRSISIAVLTISEEEHEQLLAVFLPDDPVLDMLQRVHEVCSTHRSDTHNLLLKG